MAEHAQGEWQLWTSCSWRRIRTERGEVVCEPVVAHDGHPDLVFGPNREGNIALILSAPALLEALEGLMADASGLPKRCGHDFTCVCAGNQARAAIAQAKGGK